MRPTRSTPPNNLLPHTKRFGSRRVPTRHRSLVAGSGRPGDRWVVARAPAGAGRFSAARYSTDPVHAHMERVRRDIAAILLVLAGLVTALALSVARRITRELDANLRARSHRGADVTDPPARGHRIREAKNIAAAEPFIDASPRDAQTPPRRPLRPSTPIWNVCAVILPPSSWFWPCGRPPSPCSSPGGSRANWTPIGVHSASGVRTKRPRPMAAIAFARHRIWRTRCD